MAQEVEVKVPDIGDYKDVPIIEVFVKPGDHVDKDASLVTLESEKATMDVPAPSSGVVKTMRLKVGDHVSEGDLVLVMELADSPQDAAARASAAEPNAKAAAKPEAKTEKKAESTAAAPAEEAKKGDAKPPPSKKASAGQRVPVAVPDIGDYQDVPIIEIFVKDGDRVSKDAPLITLESEKATMDVPAPADGIVRELKLKVGDTVSQGSAILSLEVDGDDAGSEPVAASERKDDAKAAEPAEARAPTRKETASETPADARADGAAAHASPSVRKFARELGVDITQVRGSGPHQRITREDLQAFIKQRLAPPQAASGAAGSGIPPIPAVDFSKFGAVSTQPLGRIRKYAAAHLQRSWLNVPHVTQHDEADITELEAFRKTASQETGVKLTLLPFVMKAVAAALRKYPEFNSSLAPDGETLVLKQYAHIGFAADTEQGLVVPVVRDVWDKNILTLARECAELAGKAREGKLKPDEMRGGCFSISSLGGIGGGFFTPIVNAPEVAILGVSRSQTKPVWDGQAFMPRLIAPLSLSYDHRVIDGAAGARFIVFLVSLLADLRKLNLY